MTSNNEDKSVGKYNDRGQFSCIDGGEIFYVESSENFEKVDNLNTVCEADGNWANQNSSWQCWYSEFNF